MEWPKWPMPPAPFFRDFRGTFSQRTIQIDTPTSSQKNIEHNDDQGRHRIYIPISWPL